MHDVLWKRDALWNRVEAELDARRSPFDDPELAAELRTDPASEAATRRLMAGLARVAAARQTPGTTAHAPIPRRGARVAAAALLVAASAGLLGWRIRRAEGAAEQLARAPALSIVVQHSTPPPALGARIELGPRRVLGWTLRGDAP